MKQKMIGILLLHENSFDGQGKKDRKSDLLRLEDGKHFLLGSRDARF